MTYYINKIAWFFLNPAMVLPLAATVGVALKRRWLSYLALGTLWFMSTLACVALLGLPLERAYVATQKVESLPRADAIVVLGGGIGQTDAMAYPDMYEGADRLWHGARLFRAGKAPKVVVSGRNDLKAAVPLLVDLGVPREAIVVDDASRNTYENSRFTEKLLGGSGSVLLVTSAWHMPRAAGNFSKTALSVTPAACDFVATFAVEATEHWWSWILPSADSFCRSTFLLREWAGRLARK